MPYLRVDRTLLTLVLGLTLLFTALGPDASAGLSLPGTAVFWLLHIGTGMLLAVAVTALLARRLHRLRQHRPMYLILLGGILGSLIFAPLALAMDRYWSTAPDVAEADDWLDVWEQRGGLWAVLAEWLSLLPPYLSSWMLVNALPVGLQRRMDAESRIAPDVAEHAAPVNSPDVAEHAAALNPRNIPHTTAAAQENAGHAAAVAPAESATAPPPAAETVSADAAAAAARQFLAQLPPAIGQDLVAIQADLHYLHVRTTLGRAMVLASLSTAEQALGNRGLRVHRSHWVALTHVRRLAQTGAGMTLQLSDGSRIPVSRRRAGEVRERLGHSFVRGADA
jgi:DNA-binding LytR/AlgR family response regulator